MASSKCDTTSICWDFGDEREHPIHRIHSYPARFPAFITTNALRYAEERGTNVNIVADVFCGCGTTAVEARRHRKQFWGCDINPVATLIAHVKTHFYSDTVLKRYFESIKTEFYRTRPTSEDYDRISDRIRYWFHEGTIDDLIRLDQAIRRTTPAGSRHRKFFFCGFSNVLKPTSRWLTKSIKAQLDPNKPSHDVFEEFDKQFTLMRKANSRNQMPNGAPMARIVTQNFLESPAPEYRADLIVTSPPYVTSYDYAEIHQLSTIWLRYASDYRALRNGMVGNRYGVRPPEPSSIDALGPNVSDIYRALLLKDRRKAYSTAAYFIDMDRAVQKCQHLLNADGIAVFVIGNTQYRGIKIDNVRHLEVCLERAGFSDIEAVRRKISQKTMTPYRDDYGRFTRDSSQRRVYNEEFVVIGRKR